MMFLMLVLRVVVVVVGVEDLAIEEFGPNWLVLLKVLVGRAVDKVVGVESLTMEEFGTN